MGFIDVIKERAKSSIKTIVLPETEDMRTLEAADKILKEGIAKLVLVGNEEAVKKSAAEGGFDISGAQIVDPATSEKTQGYIDKLVELRQKKGMTPEQAKEILLNQYLYYGVMMVKMIMSIILFIIVIALLAMIISSTDRKSTRLNSSHRT